MDGFVIDDVVQRAGYSRRTFTNHYSCKEEAVASVLHIGASTTPAFIADLPKDTSLLDALEALMRGQLDAGMLERVRNLVSLCVKYPTLEPYILAAVRHVRQSTVATLVQFAEGRYSDQYIHTLFAMAYGALSLLFDGSLEIPIPGQSGANGSEAVTLEEFLDATFAHLRSGF